MLSALPPVPAASAKRVQLAIDNVAKGLTPQGHKLDSAELLSLAWECSIDDAEAFLASHDGTEELQTALAHARSVVASKPLSWDTIES